jgi:U4/U6 small nuclear ribonucleoprotein PRP3
MKSNIPGVPPKPAAVATPPVKTNSPSPAPGPVMPNMDDLARKVAEAKRRVAEAQSKLAVKDNPYMVRPPRCLRAAG